jgi:uracil-DNA glycosylase
MKTPFNLNIVDPSWRSCLKEALKTINPDYLDSLQESDDWLPGPNNIFNAFSLPLDKVDYILLGESPYPRAQSANGFAFWDAAVTDIWSPTGLSKPVNRATSLRNIVKMLLIAENALNPNHTTQPDIANLDKSRFVQSNSALFTNFLTRGFLLLNASPVLQPTQVRKDAKAWQPFLKHILHFVIEQRPTVTLLLLGSIANEIDHLLDKSQNITKLYAEHPYNYTFINNPDILAFFRPLHLLQT